MEDLHVQSVAAAAMMEVILSHLSHQTEEVNHVHVHDRQHHLHSTEEEEEAREDALDTTEEATDEAADSVAVTGPMTVEDGYRDQLGVEEQQLGDVHGAHSCDSSVVAAESESVQLVRTQPRADVWKDGSAHTQLKSVLQDTAVRLWRRDGRQAGLTGRSSHRWTRPAG